MKLSSLSFAAISGLLLLSACTGDISDDTSTPTGQEDDRMMSHVIAAKNALAERLDIDADLIDVTENEETEWSDSCLGLGGPAESCLAAITPGYRVVMSYGGGEYTYRTNQDGTEVRAE